MSGKEQKKDPDTKAEPVFHKKVLAKSKSRSNVDLNQDKETRANRNEPKTLK